MVKIEVIIQPLRLDEVKAALASLEIKGVTIVHVLDHAGPEGLKTIYRATKCQVDMPKVKLEMVVSSLRADEVVEVVSRAARTGMPGDDCTILVYEIARGFRIRNGRLVEFVLP